MRRLRCRFCCLLFSPVSLAAGAPVCARRTRQSGHGRHPSRRRTPRERRPRRARHGYGRERQRRRVHCATIRIPPPHGTRRRMPEPRRSVGAPVRDEVSSAFVARSAAAAHAGLPSELPTQNVVALLRGSDAALAGEYIVVGAHFDHLGRSAASALDPDSAEAIRNGADDNASGTAAVMELARLLSRRAPRRSVIFVTFSGEELGLLGSQRFVDRPPVPIDRVVAMLNFDMVGRLTKRSLDRVWRRDGDGDACRRGQRGGGHRAGRSRRR